MRSESELLAAIRRRVAQVAIGPSSLRNQGAPGVISAARAYFEECIDLHDFMQAMAEEVSYQSWLNHQTKALMKRLPAGGDHWGAARKALNLFLRDVCYNTLLAGELGIPRSPAAFNRAVRWLEIPLDKDVAKGIRANAPDAPRWQGIRSLTPADSRLYQAAAQRIASDMGTARIQLDLVFWRAVE